MPTSALGLLIFVIGVAPGLFFEIVLQLRITRPQQSAFFEIGRVLLASTMIFAPASLITALVWANLRLTPLDFTSLISDDPKYIGSHAGLLALCLGVYEAASFAIAYVYNHIWFGLVTSESKYLKWLLGEPSVRRSAWSVIFDNSQFKDATPVVRVRMHSGVEWAGKLGSYTPDHEVADRELVLVKPIAYLPQGETEFVEVEDAAAALKGAEIESITVQYALNEPEKPPQSGQ